MGWRKSHLESTHLYKPVYRSKREKQKQTNKQKKTYCKSDEKHNKQQKDKHKDV